MRSVWTPRRFRCAIGRCLVGEKVPDALDARRTHVQRAALINYRIPAFLADGTRPLQDRTRRVTCSSPKTRYSRRPHPWSIRRCSRTRSCSSA